MTHSKHPSHLNSTHPNDEFPGKPQPSLVIATSGRDLQFSPRKHFCQLPFFRVT
jgi:hypothetical protein